MKETRLLLTDLIMPLNGVSFPTFTETAELRVYYVRYRTCDFHQGVLEGRKLYPEAFRRCARKEVREVLDHSAHQ